MQETKQKFNLIWFTNNLRILDNTVLSEACENGNRAIGVYCFDPRHFAETKYGFKKTAQNSHVE